MRFTLSSVELEKKETILATCTSMAILQGNKDPIEFSFNITPTGVGVVVVMVVPEYGIERDITDYGSW